MSEIVTDLSPEKISRAIDANQIEGYIYFGQGPQAEIHKESDLLWFVTGIPHPILNGVLTARFTEETLDRRIESTLNYFKSRGLPMMWWTGPATEPSDLADHLLAHGMTDGGDQPGMALDLGQLEQNRPQPEGLIIGRVNNVSDLGEWLEPVRIGFELPDFVAEAVFNNFSRLNPKKRLPLAALPRKTRRANRGCGHPFPGGRSSRYLSHGHSPASPAARYCLGHDPNRSFGGQGDCIPHWSPAVF
jgi:hypothetical protein